MLENKFLKSIRRGDMEISSIFNLKKVLFLPYRPWKLDYEVEIWYVYLVGVLNVPFGGLDFSAQLQPFTAPKKWFFGQVFSFLSFLEFVPRITLLPIELES